MLDGKSRLKMMAEKLFDQVSRDFIDDEWEVKFITDIQDKLEHDCNLSQKQIDKLEELFERY